jgi:thiamine-phosphate pyrophosphorylase
VSPLNSPPSRPILCYVTDRRSLQNSLPSAPHGLLLEKIAAASHAGVDWIQIREKDLSGKECAALTRAALLRVSKAPAAFGAARILVNDRLDVALAERAAGVHLGEQSLPVTEARRLLRAQEHIREFLVGISCHSLEAAQAAAQAGADYIFFGPVFATPSKAAYGAPQGLTRLAQVCRSVPVPVLAIGGITLEEAAACLQAGAAGVAAIRLFQDAENVSQVVQTLRELSR